MYKKLVVGGAALGLLIIAALLFFKDPVPSNISAAITTQFPIITVDSGNIFIKKDDTERLIVNGEQIEPPYMLRSEADSTATLQFADGSELRIDSNSNLEVRAAAYTDTSKSLVVQIQLSIGRVWSDIVALATPESSWEVETTNVVATVRGTAFGVTVNENNDTTIVGSEHNIELTPIDPETGERNNDQKTMLQEDEFILITNDNAQSDAHEVPKPQKKTEKEKNDPWVQLNETRDQSKTEAVGTPETQSDAPSVTLPDEKKPGEITDDTRDISQDTIIPKSIVQESDAPKQIEETVTATQPKTSTHTVTKRAVSLGITPAQKLNGIEEGARMNLTAILTYTDGSTADVSQEVTWRVIGEIGSVQNAVFIPLLNASVAELGRAPGSITAIWKDTASGSELLGATDIFEVKAKVTLLEERG